MQFADGGQDYGIMFPLPEFEAEHDLQIMPADTAVPPMWKCKLGRSQERIHKKSFKFFPLFDYFRCQSMFDYSSNVNFKAACCTIKQVLEKYDIHTTHMSKEARHRIESCDCTTIQELHDLGCGLYKNADACYLVNTYLEGNCDPDEGILHIVSLMHYSLQTQCWPTTKWVYRGMCVEWDPALKAGSMFISHRFISSSFDPFMAVNWMSSSSNINRNSIKEGVFMVIQSNTGLYENYECDYFGPEAEVIFLPNTFFEVLAVHKGVNATDYIRQLPKMIGSLKFEHVTVVECKEISAEVYKECMNETEYIGFDHSNSTY